MWKGSAKQKAQSTIYHHYSGEVNLSKVSLHSGSK